LKGRKKIILEGGRIHRGGMAGKADQQLNHGGLRPTTKALRKGLKRGGGGIPSKKGRERLPAGEAKTSQEKGGKWANS